MDTLLIQDWTTLQSNGKFNVTQGAHTWVDMGNYEDLVLYVDIKEQSGPAATLALQSAPVAQDSAFVPLASIALGVGITAIPLAAAYSALPMARFLRWQFITNGSTTTTFRIWAAAYALA